MVANRNLLYASSDFASVLYTMTMILLFLLPAISMRSFAEERKNRTDQLLLPVVGLPVSQLLSGCLVAGCTILVVWKRKKLSSGGETAHS